MSDYVVTPSGGPAIDWEDGGLVINKKVGEVEVTYATGWQCPECGLVWSPLFDGPCIHESEILEDQSLGSTQKKISTHYQWECPEHATCADPHTYEEDPHVHDFITEGGMENEYAPGKCACGRPLMIPLGGTDVREVHGSS